MFIGILIGYIIGSIVTILIYSCIIIGGQAEKNFIIKIESNVIQKSTKNFKKLLHKKIVNVIIEE